MHVAAARSPNKVALSCDGQMRSYGELSERVARLCGAARAVGIAQGDRVAILAPNCIEYPELVIGLSDAGAIVVTLSARATAREIAGACDDCGATWLFAHASLAHVAADARFATVRNTLTIGPDYEAWLAAAAPSPPLAGLRDTDPFTLVYSSGTTGKPKGIVISHRSRTLTFHGMAMEYGCYGPEDLQLGLAPMAHGAGFAFIMASLYFGGTVEILSKFDPVQVVERLASGAFTGVFMVPTHFQSIFGLPEPFLDLNRGRATRLRTIISNAAALPQAMKERIVDYWGAGRLHETYGSTEAGIVTNLRPRYQLTSRQSVGPAFALNELRLIDDSGNDVPRGEVGELYSRSPYIFEGYWGQEEETAAAMRDGWVSAGDLARQDEEGFVYIVDRKKDMVISGGLNVYPREIEEVLHQHPAVREAAVVGIPDEFFGEALRAFVVLHSGESVDASTLESHCRNVLAGYKIPKSLRFVNELPRNAGGKVLKTTLRRLP